MWFYIDHHCSESYIDRTDAKRTDDRRQNVFDSASAAFSCGDMYRIVVKELTDEFEAAHAVWRAAMGVINQAQAPVDPEVVRA